MSDVIVIVTSVFKTVVFYINICCFIILNGILAAYGAICSIMAQLRLTMALTPFVILWDINFAGKIWSGHQFRYLCQIWCEAVHIWQNYHRITDFRMAASTILEFCICKFSWQIWFWGRVFSLSIKFGANMCNNGRHLGFCRIRVLRVKVVPDLILGVCI